MEPITTALALLKAGRAIKALAKNKGTHIKNIVEDQNYQTARDEIFGVLKNETGDPLKAIDDMLEPLKKKRAEILNGRNVRDLNAKEMDVFSPLQDAILVLQSAKLGTQAAPPKILSFIANDFFPALERIASISMMLA